MNNKIPIIDNIKNYKQVMGSEIYKIKIKVRIF